MLPQWLYRYEVRMAIRFLRIFCAGFIAINVLHIYYHKRWSLTVLFLAIIGFVVSVLVSWYQYKWQENRLKKLARDNTSKDRILS